MLARSATYADVGLRSYRSALADIHPYGIFKQVINTLRRRGGNLVAAKHSYNSRHPASRQRRARGCNVHFVERHNACRVGNACLCDVRAHAYSVSLGVGQRGNAQRPDNHFTAKTREKCISLTAEVLELEALALVENCFVHIVNLND